MGPRVTGAHAPWVLTPQWFGSIAFERETARYIPFDHEITGLLVRAQRAPIDWASVAPSRRAALEGFVGEFYGRAMFTHDLLFDGEVRDVAPPDGFLTGPLVTHLEVNAVCNLKCVHCFAGELPRKERALELDELDELDELFAQLARVGAMRLALSGGEPLMRKDLYELVDLAIGHGLRVSLTTNGLLLDESHARALAAREMLWLSVSLDGATRESNDAIRGAGTYDAVLERVSVLRGRVPFSLAMTVTRTNAGEARAFAQLARAVGASGAVLRPLYPTRLAKERPELAPSFAQYRAALAELTEGAAMDEGCGLSEPYGPTQREDTLADVVGHVGCGAGTTLAAISSAGIVSPCSFLGASFDGPSIRQQPFASIWNDADVFTRLRGPLAVESFSGGCRARSLAYAGSAFARDPWLDGELERRHDPLVTLRARRRP
jgi:MoaA/NifB/PqqE/SkfB family radical SAM enzyme